MLHFFRSIRRSFFLPGKVRTYLAYALGEIVLIVVGILIALEVNNWNEGRKEQEQGKKFIKEIYQDLKAHQSRLEEVIDQFSEESSAIEAILSEIDQLDGERLSPSDFLENFAAIGKSVKIIRSDETFDELKRLGKLRTLSDDTLSGSLEKFYFSYDATLSIYDEQGSQDRIALQNLWSRSIPLSEYQYARSTGYRNAHPKTVSRLLQSEEFYKILMEILHSADLE
jgi:DNA-binding PadR family transcriptional regulator